MTQSSCYSNSNYHLYTLLIILFAFINMKHISAYGINSDLNSERHEFSNENVGNGDSPIAIDPNNFDLADIYDAVPSPWAELFHRYNTRSIFAPNKIASRPIRVLRGDQLHFIPYPAEKRTIPIELQKAFFAHGIVGRRR